MAIIGKPYEIQPDFILSAELCCFDLIEEKRNQTFGLEKDSEDIWLPIMIDLRKVAIVRCPGARRGYDNNQDNETGIHLHSGEYLIINKPWREVFALWEAVLKGGVLNAQDQTKANQGDKKR